MSANADQVRCLLVRVASLKCALPLPHVVETMRPLPVETLWGLPPFVVGLSVIRGASTPVVDLSALLGRPPSEKVTRFVTLRLADRRAALAVDEVLGTCDLAPEVLAELPPLLGEQAAERVEAIGVLDAQLLLVLRVSRLVPETVWPRLAAGGAAS
jgi:purine-binding chemotaxis protein CheW